LCVAWPAAGADQPALPGPGSPTASQRPVRLYSDLLLHDMGPALADGFPQGEATGGEFRTMPLWRVADRPHFLHDGRAASITDAILAHGGQAAAAAANFHALSDADKMRIDISPLPGAKVQEIVQKLHATSKDIVERARAAIRP